MSNEVVVKQSTAVADHHFSRDQVDLIKRTICKGATDDEMKLFLQVASKSGLDPFSRQIYAVKRWDNKENREVMAIQTSIDGLRVIAERSGVYEGQDGPHWCGEDGVWKDVWLSTKTPAACKVGVWKKNFKTPLWGVARWDEYAQKGRDGKPSFMWAKMPALMLSKVAESLALRKAFPNDICGLYSQEEMAQTTTVSHVERDPNPVLLPKAGADFTQDTVNKHLEAEYKESPKDLNSLIEKTSEPTVWAEYVIPIGKYSGKKLKEFTTEELTAFVHTVIDGYESIKNEELKQKASGMLEIIQAYLQK